MTSSKATPFSSDNIGVMALYKSQKSLTIILSGYKLHECRVKLSVRKTKKVLDLLAKILPLLGPIPIQLHTIRSGWSLVYIEGPQVILSKKDVISFNEDRICFSKQFRTR